MLAKKSRKRKISQAVLFSVIFGAITIAVTFFLVFSNWRINQKRAVLNEKIESLEKEIQEAQEKNEKLKEVISQTQSEDYLEKVARESLDLKKPGEDVLVVKPATTTAQNEPAEKSFWQKILEKLNF